MHIFIWMLGTLFFSSTLMAFPTVIPDRMACFEDLETHFFVEPIVNQGLSLYNIRQELWLLINEELGKRSAQVPMRMKKRTAYMVPNPIEYPMQKGVTAKILKEVLFEVFLEAMREYYVERPTADHIFNYIFREQLPRFIKCFGPEAQKLMPKFD